MQIKPRLTLYARSCLVIIGIILALAVSAKAATITVTSTSDSDGICPGSNCTLRQAIATAAVGDTITFGITGTISLGSGELGIARSLNIVNTGTGTVVVESQTRTTRIFNVTGGTVTISNLTLANGGAYGANKQPVESGDGGDGEGGAVLVGPSGTLTMTRCILDSNSATGGRAGKNDGTGRFGGSGNGGAVANRGHLTLLGCYFTRNEATGGQSFEYSAGWGNGGAVFNGGQGVLVMTGCTFSSNRATGGDQGSSAYSPGEGHGGGFANGDSRSGRSSNDGQFTITNCTFLDNEVEGGMSQPGDSAGAGRGGAIYVYQDDGFPVGNIINCTLAHNIARGGTDSKVYRGRGIGGGLAAERCIVEVNNTIIAKNTTESSDNNSRPSVDVDGSSVASQGYNFIGVGDGVPSSNWQSSDNVGTESTPIDPQFETTATTYDIIFVLRPKFASAVIDAGNSPLDTDQRGAARPADQPAIPNAAGGNGSDIGAYEMRSTPLTFIVTNTADSGTGSLRQAIAAANDEGQFDFIRFNIPTTDPGYDASTHVYSINLTSGELGITSSMRIDAGNARIAIGRGVETPFRLFNVSASGVTLANLFLHNGAALGAPNAPGLGGGVFNSGGLTLLNCTFSGNTAKGGDGVPQLYQGLPGGDGLGGAVCNDGTLVMTNCTLSANSVQGGVGGFGYSSNGISGKGGNGGNGRGGGLFSNQGPVTLTNCTFTKNTALGGAPGGGDTPGYPGQGISGGALFASGDTTVRNSILSGNTAAVDPNYSGTVDGKDNLIGGTPKLDSALKYNGGSTPTIALLTGSPAINGGDDATAPDADQRGYPRVGVSDVGAFEFGSALPTPTPKPTATATPKPTPTATPKATPTATPKSTPKTVLANISTRLKVETGDNTLIGGFIVTGTQPKKVIIRAIGPSLSVPGKLANPTLELRNSSGALLKANDDWKNSSAADKQAIIDSTIPPTNDLESAIVATLPANNSAYTAIVRGVNDTTGIGVVEMYDLDRNVDSKLANISTRGLVQQGDTVLIAGTIVLGPSSQKVIIRAIGPSLNIPGKLANPTLELHNGSGTLLDSNDNWKSSPDKQAIIDSTVPPTNDLESAIVATLPGNGASYTAIVRGVNNTTGIAVVEVYALQ